MGRFGKKTAGRFGLWAAAVLLVSCAGGLQAQTQRFETVAGGFVGDGLPATSAALVSPRGIAFDAAGNAYIAQEDENRIRKVSSSGVITTIAGNGTYGFNGDGGPASSAVLASPRGVAIDALGNVYFSDALNNRVRKIAINGVITTVAGNGQANSAGDGGPAANAGVQQPYGLAFDAAGNLYISEYAGHRIRKVTPSGIILTVAGTGVASFSGDGGPAIAAGVNSPTSVAVDSLGNLYFSDTFNDRIRRIVPSGTITTVAGGGSLFPSAEGVPAADSRILLPYGIAADADGNIYIADNNCFIDKLTPAGLLHKIAGGEGWCIETGDGGPALDANIFGPEGVAVDATGSVYFTDSGSFSVRKISGGIIDTVIGVGSFYGDGGPATGAVISLTRGLTIGNAGEIYIADGYANGRVRKVGADGTIETVAGNGSMGWSGDGGPATEAGMYFPWDVEQDDAGNLYIVDTIMNVVRKVAPNGIISTVAGGGSLGFSGDGGPATQALMRRPRRVALDGAGNLYIADYGNHRIRKVGTDGIISTVVGTGAASFAGDGGPATSAAIRNPSAVAFDAAGNLYIADYGNNRIRKVGADGVISTVAGNGLFGPAGDGGPATQAALTGPTGIAFDSYGAMYVVGSTLRKVASDGTISTIAGMKHNAYDVAIGADDTVYVAAPSGRILKGMPARAESDYDGDAVSDLFWRNASTGSNMVWPSADFGSSHSAMAVPDQAWAVAGSGDFDNDGHADLLWRNGGTGAASVWKSADASTSYYLTTVSDLAWKIVGTGDFDEDGASDILWRNTANGSNAIWRSGDSATQLPIATVANQDWHVAGVGDFDGDGRSDIFWRNGATGANTIWKSGDAAAAQSVAAVYNLALKIVGTGDFNGDGKADVLWRNAGTGANAIWNSADPTTIRSLPSVYNANWQVYGTGDYDGDGKADILWRHGGTGAATIWKGGDHAQLQNVTQISDMNWKIVD